MALRQLFVLLLSGVIALLAAPREASAVEVLEGTCTAVYEFKDVSTGTLEIEMKVWQGTVRGELVVYVMDSSNSALFRWNLPKAGYTPTWLWCADRENRSRCRTHGGGRCEEGMLCKAWGFYVKSGQLPREDAPDRQARLRAGDEVYAEHTCSQLVADVLDGGWSECHSQRFTSLPPRGLRPTTWYQLKTVIDLDNDRWRFLAYDEERASWDEWHPIVSPSKTAFIPLPEGAASNLTVRSQAAGKPNRIHGVSARYTAPGETNSRNWPLTTQGCLPAEQ